MEWVVYSSGNTITLMKIEAESVRITSRNGFKLVEFERQAERTWTITVPPESNPEDILAELVIHKNMGRMGFSKNLLGEDRIIFIFAEEELSEVLRQIFNIKCNSDIKTELIPLLSKAVV
ncbi:hypothetical protein [Thermococcus sp. 21S7]|uniref:hypothetical protein n=1 Tax=Thermococcus sp. 21S7 TaxID=1638221 RepID=UPI00143BAC1C|nr:hypothetical protein [Thermococcus sp. 21S7]NJE60517.1 hypothetical protein [Thermococcus sp. 21S7]